MKTLTMLTGVFILAMAVPALSQGQLGQPTFDASGGYSFLWDQPKAQSFHGWVASAAGYFNPWLGVESEVRGEYGTGTDQLPGFDPADAKYRSNSFVVGPRFVFGATRRSTAFFHVLGGAAWVKDVYNTDVNLEPSLGLGGGVDVWMRPSFGIRAGGDLRLRDWDAFEYRAQVGLVVRKRRR